MENMNEVLLADVYSLTFDRGALELGSRVFTRALLDPSRIITITWMGVCTPTQEGQIPKLSASISASVGDRPGPRIEPHPPTFFLGQQ